MIVHMEKKAYMCEDMRSTKRILVDLTTEKSFLLTPVNYETISVFLGVF